MFNIFHVNKTLAASAGVLFLLACSSQTKAQDISIAHDLIERKVTFFNNDGKLFENPYVNISGSPFLFEPWKYGIIEIDAKNVFSNIQMKLDLHSQQVLLKKPDGAEIVIKPGAVKKITLFDSTGSSPVLYFYQCGFPAVDNQNVNNFYQLLSDGKIKFLKSRRKWIKEEKDSFSGETKKEFVSYEDYYFFADDKMLRLKRDKEFILGIVKDKKGKIDEYLQSNKISFKSVEDIKKLLDYYNSL